MAAPRQPDHNHENHDGDLDLPKAASYVPGSSLWTAPGLEFRPSLACHSALLSSGFLHVSHDDSASAHLGLRLRTPAGRNHVPSGGTYRCQLGAKVIAHPYPELQGT